MFRFTSALIVLMLFFNMPSARAEDPRGEGILAPLPGDDGVDTLEPEDWQPTEEDPSAGAGEDPDAAGSQPLPGPDSTSAPLPVLESSLDKIPDWEPQVDKALAARVDQYLKDEALKGALAGIFAVQYPEGRVLFWHNQDQPMNPASVIKVVTAVSAIELLGPDAHFPTRLFFKDGVLYLQGTGTPALGEKDLDVLAQMVKQAGIGEVRKLVLDVGHFDKADLPPQFDQKNTDAYYRPSTGALALSEGKFVVKVRAAEKLGGTLIVETEPFSDYFIIDNTATTTEEDLNDLEVRVTSSAGRAAVRVRGSLPIGHKGLAVLRRIPEPNKATGWILGELLKRRGVEVSQREPLFGPAPGDAQLLGEVTGPALKSSLVKMVRESVNFIAEQVARNLGVECSPRTWSCSISAMAGVMKRLGLTRKDFKLVNGSGLYDANQISPRQMVRFLISAMNRKNVAPVLLETFALSGKRGTLRSRLKEVEGRVYGKTGTLDQVSCLAGLVRTGKGGDIYFAIFFNNTGARANSLRRLQDRILLAIIDQVERPGKLKNELKKGTEKKKSSSKKKKKSKHRKPR